MVDKMKFGVFLVPFNLPNTQNANWALHRSVDFVKYLDTLGFDEVWFGEHHSGGCEIIGDPITMIAHCAPQTKNIKLGTGVLSTPYHNPLWVAERMVFVDHLTRGRAMYGLGPGVLATDARMISMDPLEQRGAFEEDVDAIMHLLRTTEPLTVETSRYKLQDALVQLPPYSDFEVLIAAVVSPSGPRIAGKHGLSLMSLAATMTGGTDALMSHRQVVEERAEEFGISPAPRENWRLVGPMHLAETREQAIEDVRYGLDLWFDYMQNVGASPQFSPAGSDFDERVSWIIDNGIGVIGTPDDMIAQLRKLEEMTGGGFGSFLFQGTEWANYAATKRSAELFAQFVMPEFQHKRLDRRQQTEQHCRDVVGGLVSRQAQALEEAKARHAADRAAKGAGATA